MVISTSPPTEIRFFRPIEVPSSEYSVGKSQTSPHWAAWQREAWGKLIDDCLKIRRLVDDYDGQGALAPDHDLVDGAIRLACRLRDDQFPPAHHVTAGVDGTVHFEWVEANRSLDIEVVAPGLAEVCEVDLIDDVPPICAIRW